MEIAKINNRVDMIECQHSKVDPKLLIGIKAFDLQRCLRSSRISWRMKNIAMAMAIAMAISIAMSMTIPFLRLGSNLVTVTCHSVIYNNLFKSLMINQGKDLYRYKGVISVKGMDKRFVFQGVHMLFGGDFTEP